MRERRGEGRGEQVRDEGRVGGMLTACDRGKERESGGGGAEGKVSSAATAVQHKDERNGEGEGRESERTNEKERREAEV